MAEFPSDEMCHFADDKWGSLCREPVAYTLLVEGGGFVAKLCDGHFTELTTKWERAARAQGARFEASHE